MTRSATITGVGSTLPPRLVPNTWFEDKIDTNDEWIRERTGIEARHFVEEGVDT
ncbi:MAG TPA: 3-oxoacyl-ACP synthase, partial [Actinomycetota bacterium]